MQIVFWYVSDAVESFLCVLAYSVRSDFDWCQVCEISHTILGTHHKITKIVRILALRME